MCGSSSVLSCYTHEFTEGKNSQQAALSLVCNNVFRRDLDRNYREIIQIYRKRFLKMYKLGIINMTPKCHVLFHHLEHIMSSTGKSLALSDCNGLEGCIQGRSSTCQFNLLMTINSNFTGMKKSDILHSTGIKHCQGIIYRGCNGM